jgi:arylsulfatase A-like enzyme
MTRKPTNLILITVDSLRPDHLGCYGYPRNTSPNIDNLASRGMVFRQAISNGGATPQAFPAMLASILPPLDQDGYKGSLKTNVTIAEVLKKNGYQTAAFHCNAWLSRFYHYDKGFDTFDDGFAGKREPLSLNRALKRKLRNILLHLPILNELRVVFRSKKAHPTTADEITAKAISWLKNRPDRFFLWLHYMDTHLPYMPPSDYLKYFHSQSMSKKEMFRLSDKVLRNPDSMLKSEKDALICLYDASIRYVDDAIGRLLDELKGEALDNTAVVLVADHGEAFGEHGEFFHNKVYEALIRVPLIIKVPGIEKRIVIEEQYSLMDLAPTIVELSGIQKVESFCGESLLPVIEGKREKPPVIISVAFDPYKAARAISCRTESWKYIRTEIYSGGQRSIKRELYNLQNDPGEARNLPDEERAAEFEAIISDYLSKVDDERLRGKARNERERIEKKIRNLKISRKI